MLYGFIHIISLCGLVKTRVMIHLYETNSGQFCS